MSGIERSIARKAFTDITRGHKKLCPRGHAPEEYFTQYPFMTRTVPYPIWSIHYIYFVISRTTSKLCFLFLQNVALQLQGFNEELEPVIPPKRE